MINPFGYPRYLLIVIGVKHISHDSFLGVNRPFGVLLYSKPYVYFKLLIQGFMLKGRVVNCNTPLKLNLQKKGRSPLKG